MRAAVRVAQLSELAEEAIRHATRAERPEDAVDGDVRTLVRRTCAMAHARGVRAEQLLLLLKEAWQTLPEAHRVPRHVAGDVLARLITTCIHEYYAQGGRSLMAATDHGDSSPRAPSPG